MSSTAEQNIQVIKEWLDAHNRDDIEGELAFWDDHVEMTIIPTGKIYNGIDELRAAAQMAVSPLRDPETRKTLARKFPAEPLRWCRVFPSVGHST